MIHLLKVHNTYFASRNIGKVADAKLVTPTVIAFSKLEHAEMVLPYVQKLRSPPVVNRNKKNDLILNKYDPRIITQRPVDLQMCRIVEDHEMKIIPEMLVSRNNVCVVHEMHEASKSFQMTEYDLYCIELHMDPDPDQLERCFDLRIMD